VRCCCVGLCTHKRRPQRAGCSRTAAGRSLVKEPADPPHSLVLHEHSQLGDTFQASSRFQAAAAAPSTCNICEVHKSRQKGNMQTTYKYANISGATNALHTTKLVAADAAGDLRCHAGAHTVGASGAHQQSLCRQGLEVWLAGSKVCQQHESCAAAQVPGRSAHFHGHNCTTTAATAAQQTHQGIRQSSSKQAHAKDVRQAALWACTRRAKV
jgi:hypothetical protein